MDPNSRVTERIKALDDLSFAEDRDVLELEGVPRPVSGTSPFEQPTEIDDMGAQEHAAGLYRRALERERLGEVDSAIQLLMAALEVNTSSIYLNRLALLHARRGDFELGVRLLGEAIRIMPDNRIYQRNLMKLSELRDRSRRVTVVGRPGDTPAQRSNSNR